MTRCELCTQKTRVQADLGCTNGVVDWCKLRSRPLFWSEGKYVGCEEGKPTLRGRISDWWTKFVDSQTTDYEKHMDPKGRYKFRP